MRTRVERLRLLNGEWRTFSDEEGQLSLSDNKAMLSGPQFDHKADGVVTSTSLPYAGAPYHVRLDVMVIRSLNAGTYVKERWFVRLLEIGEPEKN